MGGWFLGILIGYWVRAVIRMYKGRGSNKWLIEKATVMSSSASNDHGGPVAEVIYSFRHQEKYLSGTHQKPFLSYDSAKKYVSGFPKDTRFSVRVNPENPKISIVRDEDQDQTAMKLRARFDKPRLVCKEHSEEGSVRIQTSKGSPFWTIFELCVLSSENLVFRSRKDQLMREAWLYCDAIISGPKYN